MSVLSLQQAIAQRASELVPAILVSTGVQLHKKGWKSCPCTWCKTKREATVVIGSHVPSFRNVPYAKEWVKDWRFQKRIEFRAKMARLEKE